MCNLNVSNVPFFMFCCPQMINQYLRSLIVFQSCLSRPVLLCRILHKQYNFGTSRPILFRQLISVVTHMSTQNNLHRIQINKMSAPNHPMDHGNQTSLAHINFFLQLIFVLYSNHICYTFIIKLLSLNNDSFAK